MALIIDGYNLLYASGILGRGVGPGSLERSRSALLNFLAESLDERLLKKTTVVFDARLAPPGLPRTVGHRGIAVRFAEGSGEADDLIEQLIAADTSPRRLTVVSSDHRLHRAARRRGAKPIDSDLWYSDTLRKRIERQRAKPSAAKPSGPATEAEVRYWLRQFGVEPPDADAEAPRPAEPPARSPFPPGYAEDVGEENV